MADISTFDIIEELNSFDKFPPKSGFQTKRRHMALKRHIKKANSSKNCLFLTVVFLFFVLLSKAIRLNECVSWIKMKNLLNFHLPLHLRHCPSDMTLGSSQARSAVFLLTRGGVCGTGEPINGSFIWHNGRIERK